MKIQTHTIGEQIRAARDARGWTTTRLAEEAGVSIGLISKIENDGGARNESIQKVAAVLGLVLVVSVELRSESAA
jgi:transcriptional regulator with XRE-family HTH domain